MCIYDPLSLTEGLRFQLLTPSPLASDTPSPSAATRPCATSFNPSSTAQTGGKLPLSTGATAAVSSSLSHHPSSSSSSSSQSTSNPLNEPRNASGQGLGLGSLHHRRGSGVIIQEEGEDGSDGHNKQQLQVTLRPFTTFSSSCLPSTSQKAIVKLP